jgi:hypothetical protein
VGPDPDSGDPELGLPLWCVPPALTATKCLKDNLTNTDGPKTLLAVATWVLSTTGPRPRVLAALLGLFLDLTGAEAAADVAAAVAEGVPAARVADAAAAAGVPVFSSPAAREAAVVPAAAALAALCSAGDAATPGAPGVAAALLAVASCGTAAAPVAVLNAMLWVSLAATRARLVRFVPWPAATAAALARTAAAVRGTGPSPMNTWVQVCLSCCTVFVDLTSATTRWPRFFVGSQGVNVEPCPTCYCTRGLRCPTGTGPCGGTGTMLTCANEVGADRRNGQSKRCGTQLASYDLAAGLLVVQDVAVALCGTCGARFRYTTGARLAGLPACDLCGEWAGVHGAPPAPIDVTPVAEFLPGVAPTARLALPALCAVCGLHLVKTRAFGAVGINVGTPRPGAPTGFRTLALCEAHAGLLDANPMPGTLVAPHILWRAANQIPGPEPGPGPLVHAPGGRQAQAQARARVRALAVSRETLGAWQEPSGFQPPVGNIGPDGLFPMPPNSDMRMGRSDTPNTFTELPWVSRGHLAALLRGTALWAALEPGM